MKLSISNLSEIAKLPGYHVPSYDVPTIRKSTIDNPVWLHYGGGNLFRAFQAPAVQKLIESGKMVSGVITCESYDEGIVEKCFRKVDDLCVQVILNTDGTVEKNVIGSIAQSLCLYQDMERVKEIYASPTLQMISFTITEKGYLIKDKKENFLPNISKDIVNAPEKAESFLSILTYLLIYRMRTCGVPLAMVSMDNCAHNGEKLRDAITTIANEWLKNGKIAEDEYDFVANKVKYPWTMIDRITPRPAPDIADQLESDGMEDMKPFITDKGTYIAPYVITEAPNYLVIEDDFPNGKPPLDELNIIYTNRENVNNCELMKVCTCLNPPQTAMAIYGCLLGYTSIAKEFEDSDIRLMIENMCYQEGMPVVVDPKVLSPEAFEKEVFDLRLPNLYIRDTPQRIASDTSQKLPFRFGVNITRYMSEGTEKASSLIYMPLVYAGWLRYLIGVDDDGKEFKCSYDPRLEEMQQILSGLKLGVVTDEDRNAVRTILRDITVTGADLSAAGLEDKIVAMWESMMQGPGAVRSTVHHYVTD